MSSPAGRIRLPKKALAPASRTLWIWAFLVPTTILYGLFTLYPIIASYWYSLVDWNGFDAEQTFVGIQNYQRVLADPQFWNSFRITLLFIVTVVPIKVFASLALASALNSPKMPFTAFFRTIYFLPVVTTTAIVGVVMQFVFDPVSGPVNLVLLQAGIIDRGINFLGQSSTAIWTTAGVYIWKGLGITMIYWLAALQTIPRDLYEAARIDGARTDQLFRYITLPLLKPFLVIITLLTIESSLHVFDLMYTMTSGGPYFATEVIEIYIYRWAFLASIPQLGFASATAVLFGVFVLGLGLLQLASFAAVRRQSEGK